MIEVAAKSSIAAHRSNFCFQERISWWILTMARGRNRKGSKKVRQLEDYNLWQQVEHKSEIDVFDDAVIDIYPQPSIKESDNQDFVNEYSAKSKKSDVSRKLAVDLHGYTVEQAKQRLMQFFASLPLHEVIELTVITGRGRNSVDGEPILAKEIPPFIARHFAHLILKSEQDPMAFLWDKRPIRGYYKMWCRKSK